MPSRTQGGSTTGGLLDSPLGEQDRGSLSNSDIHSIIILFAVSILSLVYVLGTGKSQFSYENLSLHNIAKI